MDDKIISFISCVNNDIYYNQCLSYIDKLEIPVGYSIEKIDIRGEKSICKAYNIAMKKAKGCYKVYIHQDAGIVNTHFIKDMLEVFKDQSVGLMGMVGAGFLDSSAIWWNRQDLCVGMARHFCGTSPIFKNPETVFEDVVAVDGLLIATQFDLPWREDILEGFHFYDISQCMEFYKNNLRVVVPRQEEIWVNHGFDARSANLTGYEENRLITIKEYEKIYIRTAIAPEKPVIINDTAIIESSRNIIDNSDVKLYVLTHTPCTFIKAESLYPIASNKDIGEKLNIISTDTLDNINSENNLFAEFTSFYWAWKNDTSSQYISFFNYNKYLILNENPEIINDNYEYGWNRETVKSIFENYDIVVSKPLNFEMTIYEQYYICHKDNLLDKLMEVVRRKYPWVAESFEIALQSKSGYYFNLFVMKKSDFDNYMKFAFNIFSEIKKEVKEDLKEKSFSYLGERLFNCYVEYLKKAENFKVKEVYIYKKYN